MCPQIKQLYSQSPQKGYGNFRNFVNTYGVGARPKDRQRSWYRVLSQQKFSFFFRNSSENETEVYVYFRYSLHIKLFFSRSEPFLYRSLAVVV